MSAGGAGWRRVFLFAKAELPATISAYVVFPSCQPHDCPLKQGSAHLERLASRKESVVQRFSLAAGRNWLRNRWSFTKLSLFSAQRCVGRNASRR